MMDFVKEIREQRAQGATETEILLTLITAYDKEEIDFDELMKRVNALNSEFNAQYDVSPLDDGSAKDEVSLDEEAKADELFGMTATDNNENEKQEQSTMEDEE
jgi:hypothetical protein